MIFQRNLNRVVRIGIALGMVGVGTVGVRGSAAQEERPRGSEVTLPRVVVTASRLEEPLEETASSVTVITRREIEERQATTVADLLRSVPEASVIRSGSAGTVTSVFLRGGNSSHTLVLIDGVRVNSPTTGAFDFAHLTPDEVERIEVVRGPLSALYGSDAVGGVVNIITRKGEGKPRYTVESEFGSYKTVRERGEATGQVGLLRYAATASRTDSGGRFSHDEYNSTSLSVRTDYQASPELSLTTAARYLHTFKDFPPVQGRFDFTLGAPDPGQSIRQDFTTVNLGGTHTPTGWWSHQLQFSLVADDVDFQDPLGSVASSHLETTRMTAEWIHTVRPFSWGTITLGATVEQAKAHRSNSVGVQDINTTLTNQAYYIQNRLEAWERLLITTGVRVDDHSSFGTHVTPRASAAFLFPETGTKIRGVYSEGFRAPTINDLAFPGFSTPTLNPERSRGIEAGVEQTFWDRRIRVGVTGFRNLIRDLIVAAPPSFLPVNINRAKTQGIEVTAEFHPISSMDVGASYSYLEMLDGSTSRGLDLLRRPANTWALTVNYRPLTWVRLNANLLYVGKRDDIHPTSFGRVKNPKYVKLDLAASYDLIEKAGPLAKLTLFGRLENLLGDRYDEALGFPAPGRTLHLGIRGVF